MDDLLRKIALEQLDQIETMLGIEAEKTENIEERCKMTTLKDISEYSKNECMEVFRKHNGCLEYRELPIVINQWFHYARVVIDGRKFEITLEYHDQDNELIVDKCDFSLSGFDAICELNKPTIYFPNKLRIELETIPRWPEIKCKEMYREIVMFMRGASLNAELFSEREKIFKYEDFLVEQERDDYDGEDVKNQIFWSNYEVNYIEVNAKSIMVCNGYARSIETYTNSRIVICPNVHETYMGEEECGIIVLWGLGRKYKGYYDYYWLDKKKSNRILIGKKDAKAESILIELDEKKSKIDKAISLLYACAHFDLYQNEIVYEKTHKKPFSRSSVFHIPMVMFNDGLCNYSCSKGFLGLDRIDEMGLKTSDIKLWDEEKYKRLIEGSIKEKDNESEISANESEENTKTTDRATNSIKKEEFNPEKAKCRKLREIRKKIAEANDIDFQPAPCFHKGYCAGTCPVCDDEIEFIDKKIKEKVKKGEKINLVGISKLDIKLSKCDVEGREKSITMGAPRFINYTKDEKKSEPRGSSVNSFKERVEKLKTMKESDLLSDEEFAVLKEELIKEIKGK